MKWKYWVLFAGLLWICQAAKTKATKKQRNEKLKIKKYLLPKNQIFLVPDNFNGVINARPYLNRGDYIVFLPRDGHGSARFGNRWPQMKTLGDDLSVYVTKFHANRKLELNVLNGTNCAAAINGTEKSKCQQTAREGSCQITCVQPHTCKNQIYDEALCNEMRSPFKDRYLFKIPDTKCWNCNNPVKGPEKELGDKELKDLGLDLNTGGGEGGEISSAQAAEVMTKMSNVAASVSGYSVALNLGGGVKGVLVKEEDPEELEEVSIGYQSTSMGINILDNQDSLAAFSRSVTIPKEAFQQSATANVSQPFAAVLRFLNMSKDEKNSTVLGNEVIAIEMGTMITNLSDKLSVNFKNMRYDGVPSCHSWNGEGGRPNWTDAGCETIKNGSDVTCRCTHLTFFAILMGSPEETISSSDLRALTTITQIGCGLSLFFLGIVFFMHCLLRRTKASKATKILMQLVSALFLLNITFLINNNVAQMGSPVGCTIMAAVMHYAMLASFTWFAAQAFHLCLQLRLQGKINIRRYMVKMCVISWVLPGVIVIVLLATSKYGEQVIQTSDNVENVTMCWITDNNAHYVVNIGYYALVFIFTMTTFIVIVTWLFCLRRSNAANTEGSGSGARIVSILGLCSMLGVSWGLAFFAHGALLIPSYYTFTIINSLQGFFLFIYYYKTREVIAGKSINADSSDASSSSSTLKTGVENPYGNMQDVKNKLEG